jgi:hypothetical protein
MEDTGSPKTTKEYPHAEYSILLPADAMMPVHQRNHRLYDRFLPFFAQYLPPGALVVDVGAYCGDTMAAMLAANPGLRFVCIEGDGDRFDLLEENVRRIQSALRDVDVHTVRAYVGTDAGAAFSGQLQALDQILQAEQTGRVWLLKSDTDGHDFDVLDSAGEVLRRDWPMLFFECENHSAEDMAAFLGLFERLRERGYTHWVLFDNFGAVMLETADLEVVRQLLDYVWRQNLNLSTRTIYYFDILAATRVDRRIVTRIVADYKELA